MRREVRKPAVAGNGYGGKSGHFDMSEEQEYWRRLIDELNEKFTLEYIAHEAGVTVRQVSNWKQGDRPLGFKAIKLYLLHARVFHGKHGTAVQETGTPVHGDIEEKG